MRGRLIGPENRDCMLKIRDPFWTVHDCLCGLCYICVFLHDNLNNMQIVVLAVGPEMAMDFSSKEVEPRLMRGGGGGGGCPWTAHVLFLGTVKNSPDLLDWAENVHVLFA